MATKKEVNLIKWEWAIENQSLINWRQVCRDSNASYSKVVNAFRYKKDPDYITMKSISPILIELRDTMETEKASA